MPPSPESPRIAVVACDVTIDWNLARTRRDAGEGVAWNSVDSTRTEEFFGLDPNRSAKHAVPDAIKQNDRDLVLGIPRILSEAGYAIVRMSDRGSGEPQ